MLLTLLHNLHIKLHRHKPQSTHPSKAPSHTLIRIFSSSLRSDLKKQHHLHIVDEVRLLTLPSQKIEQITNAFVNLGVELHHARLILIKNNFDYDKAVTDLATRVLRSRSRGEEDWRSSSRIIARLIESKDTLLEMDGVLKVMMSASTPCETCARKHKVCEYVIDKRMCMKLGRKMEELLREREETEKKTQEWRDMRMNQALENTKGEDCNMEQD